MTRPDVLSARQEAALHMIRDWIAETGESPSVRQFGVRVGLIRSQERSSRTSSPAGRSSGGGRAGCRVDAYGRLGP
ncbi:hypothetical protein OH786_00485 [Streptomyces atratus]|uniref:LexA family protein n=1 Tax=Streptomyces atratus TaxID=1893 RepID=UPI0009A0D07B|nr:hypothetical protein [Streptomyces atratus]